MRGKKVVNQFAIVFISQPLRMKSQMAEINGSFAIDFNRPKMSSSVFYRSLMSELVQLYEVQHNIIQSITVKPIRSSLNHCSHSRLWKDSLFSFPFPIIEALELGKPSTVFIRNIPLSTVNIRFLWWKCRYKKRSWNFELCQWKCAESTEQSMWPCQNIAIEIIQHLNIMTWN